jgi:hypothetical protein
MGWSFNKFRKFDLLIDNKVVKSNDLMFIVRVFPVKNAIEPKQSPGFNVYIC